jgi:radical SAM superfamily enzyme YgiQ (UPF0313 family)
MQTAAMAKVAFVQKNLNENLGAMQLSACLKEAGHQTECFIEAEEKNLVRSVAQYEPNIIGFTVISGMHKWCLETAAKLKTRRNFIVFGGPHPTFFPEVIEHDAVDAICIGEGDFAMVELADRIADPDAVAAIANLHVKHDGRVVRNDPRRLVEDLDSLPYPDRALFYKYDSLRRNSRKTILAGRGCPYSCTFCFNSAYRKLYGGKGPHVRYRSAENVVGEILRVKEQYGMKSVYFQDDTLIVDKNWMMTLLSVYRRKVGLPFTCLVRADLVEEDLIRALAEAGCVAVHFGVESGNQELRNLLLKKGVSDAQIVHTAALLKRYGVKFKTYNILRLPHETIEDAFRTVALNASIRTDYPWASIFLPYPKTELTQYMIDHDLLQNGYCVDDLSASFFNPTNLSEDERQFINLQRLFFYAVKLPWLQGLIRRLIKVRPNRLYDALFLLAHAYNYKGSENMSVRDVIRFGLKAVRTSL